MRTPTVSRGAGFFDVAQNGALTVDWLGFAQGQFQKLEAAMKPKVVCTAQPYGPSTSSARVAHEISSWGDSSQRLAGIEKRGGPFAGGLEGQPVEIVDRGRQLVPVEERLQRWQAGTGDQVGSA